MANIREVKFSSEARTKMLAGVDLLANAVKATLGPSGRNVVISRITGNPRSTKDGVTVAKEIELEDVFENLGAQMVKEVASKSNDQAGDGTTTATVLAQAIFGDGVKALASGVNPMDLKRGIEKAVVEVIRDVQSRAKPVTSREEIVQVGTISANGDKAIGEMIATAMEKVGKDGVITIEEAKAFDTELDVVDGLQFEKGYIAPHFVTNGDKMVAELENPYILILDKKLATLQPIIGILEAILQGDKSLLLIAEDLEGEALSTLILNKLRGALKVVAVKSPSFGDSRKSILQDIATITGGMVVSDDIGVSVDKMSLQDLGRAKKVRVTKDSTTIIEGMGDKRDIEQRIESLRTQIQETDDEYSRIKLTARLAKLAGGVAVIRVGGASEVEVKERRDRIEDAVHATRAAVEEGIIAGGGTALLYARECLSLIETENRDEEIGVGIIKRAIETPIRQICANAGVEGSIIINQLMTQTDTSYGYDARGRRYGNLVTLGIVDPVKVVRTALQGAASVAALMIITEAVIVEVPKKVG